MKHLHVHQCPHGCDECHGQDCAQRRVGKIPACDCPCHVRCFRLAQPSPDDLPKLDALLRVVDGGGTLVEARAEAGLSPGQAARVSGIAKDRLLALEAGAALTADEWALLTVLYDVAGFTVPKPPGAARTVRKCEVCHHVWCTGDADHHERFCTIPALRRTAN